jgi:hypothetical protein
VRSRTLTDAATDTTLWIDLRRKPSTCDASVAYR